MIKNHDNDNAPETRSKMVWRERQQSTLIQLSREHSQLGTCKHQLAPFKNVKHVKASREFKRHLEMLPGKVNSVPVEISSPPFVQTMEAAGRASEEHSRVPIFKMWMIEYASI